MNDDQETKVEIHEGGIWGFFTSLFAGLVRDAIKLVIAFAIGTGAGAIVCWYYGIPLAVSLLGGILVLGVALVFTTDSLFS